MRDIRTDLRERTASLNGRYADEMVEYERKRAMLDTEHFEIIEAIKRERAAIEQLLSIENTRPESNPLPVQANMLIPLMDFLIAKVCAFGPISKDRLRAEADAAGYFDEGNGRAFHTTLLNIVRGGKIIQQADGQYLVPTIDVSLFNLDCEGSAEARDLL